MTLYFCLTKEHLDHPEGQVEVESLPNWKLFLTRNSNQEKIFFFKMSTSNEASDPRTLYLYKIGLEVTREYVDRYPI